MNEPWTRAYIAMTIAHMYMYILCTRSIIIMLKSDVLKHFLSVSICIRA